MNTTESQIILGRRLTGHEFIFSEAILFVAQTAVFFLVAVLMSGLLNHEAALLEFVNSKINKNTMSEFAATLVALVAVLGVFSIIAHGAARSSSGFIRRIVEEVMNDAPRIIYASGSSITGAVLASGVYLLNHPEVQTVRPTWWWFSMAAFFAVFFFGLGAALNFWLKRQSHLVPKAGAH